MTTAELLTELRSRGVTLAVDGDRVRVSAPRGTLTPELHAAMAERKVQILEWLRDAKQAHAPLPPLRPVRRDGRLPVSFAQQRLWFLQQMDPDSPAYTIASAVRFPADTPAALIERALTEVVRRQESLRTSFAVAEGEPSPVIAPAAPVSLPVVDLCTLREHEQDAEARRLWSQEAGRAFDLSSGPPVRFLLIRTATHASLLVTQHHIITDRWSMGLFLRELAVACEHVRGGRPLPPDLPVQYVDFASWQRDAVQTGTYREHLSYWKQHLAGPLPLLDLPLDRPRPPVQTFAGAWESRVLPPKLRTGLTDVAQREGVTPFMVLLAVFGALLSRYAGQEDVVVGSPIAGRTERLTEGIIGCFVNTLVLRLDLSGRPTFRQLIARTRDVALNGYAHQDVQFEHLVAELHPQRDLSRSPVFQVAFNYQNAPKSVEVTEAMSITTSGASMFDLSVTVNEAAAGLQATFEYNVALFDRETIDRLLRHFQILLYFAIEYPDLPVAFAPLLAEEERTEIDQWNSTGAAYPRDARLQDLVAGQAARTPDRVAVVSGDETMTYGELVAHANRVARGLRHAGVGRGDRVGVCVERSARMLPALLGVLRAGAAYVPLDPAFPPDRLAYMVQDAALEVVVTDHVSESTLPDTVTCRLYVDRDSDLWHQAPGALDAEATGPEDPAYVIYTSGSTGRPKGVEIPHRALVNFLTTMAHRPGLSAEDVLVSVTTLSFDIAGLELFLPLTVGARVVVATRAEATDGARLIEVLTRSGATVLQATPATWRLLLEGGWQGRPAVRMFCGGEACPRDLANALLSRTPVLWNLYGPTETTIWSSIERVAPGESTVSIGRPIGNTQLYVLDAAGQMVPPGVPGELYIGGDGLAHGYLNRPELTAERFLPDPFVDRPGSRMYRTGDIAKYRRDGRVDCLGRVDHQVKLRGFRLELGEIEAALVDHDAVRQAVVTMQADASGEARLVAFFVADRGAAPTASDLRKHLRKRLPDYMIPSFFMELGALPLTQNGKVDRLALPRAFGSAGGREKVVPPRTATERAIAEIWQSVLGIGPVGVHDNFFDVGGHSLASMKVIARVEQALGLRLHPRDLLLDSLEQIAASCDRRLQTAAAAAVLPVAMTAGAGN